MDVKLPILLSVKPVVAECEQLGYLVLLVHEEFNVKKNNGFLIKEDDE